MFCLEHQLRAEVKELLKHLFEVRHRILFSFLKDNRLQVSRPCSVGGGNAPLNGEQTAIKDKRRRSSSSGRRRRTGTRRRRRRQIRRKRRRRRRRRRPARAFGEAGSEGAEPLFQARASINIGKFRGNQREKGGEEEEQEEEKKKEEKKEEEGPGPRCC